MKKRVMFFSLGVVVFAYGAGFVSAFVYWKKPDLPEPVQRHLPPSAIPLPLQGKLSLFVLAGQSNMSGRGGPVDFPDTGRIFLFANDYHWKVAREPIDDSDHQVDAVSVDANAGTGPGLAFASALAKAYPGKAFGLIPCAKGATTLFEWERRLGDDTLYGSCLKRVQAASVMGHLEGLLFFQGEWDALDEGGESGLIAPNWISPGKHPGARVLYAKENLKSRLSFNRPSPSAWTDMFADFVDDFRRDVRRPDLPVVFAQIGIQTKPDRYPHWDEVKNSQESVSLPRVSMIKTDDMELGDSVHYTTRSYVLIGERFADAYLTLTDPSKVTMASRSPATD